MLILWDLLISLLEVNQQVDIVLPISKPQLEAGLKPKKQTLLKVHNYFYTKSFTQNY